MVKIKNNEDTEEQQTAAVGQRCHVVGGFAGLILTLGLFLRTLNVLLVDLWCGFSLPASFHSADARISPCARPINWELGPGFGASFATLTLPFFRDKSESRENRGEAVIRVVDVILSLFFCSFS